jgi:hypothetical protein
MREMLSHFWKSEQPSYSSKPAIAQLVEHLTVDICSHQMVPGSIPGGRMFLPVGVFALKFLMKAWTSVCPSG